MRGRAGGRDGEIKRERWEEKRGDGERRTEKKRGCVRIRKESQTEGDEKEV